MSFFPRYSDNQKSYSSLDHLQQHAPHLLNPPPSSSSSSFPPPPPSSLLPSLPPSSLFPPPASSLQVYEGQSNAPSSFQSKGQLLAPTVQLTGHGGEVYCVKFSNDGNMLATAGFDKQILLWDIYNECTNVSILKGHTNAVLELHWSTDNARIYTGSADKTVAIWDVETNKRIKKFTGHTSFVNSIHPARRGPDLIASGSDDGFTRIWDLRVKSSISEFANKYPVTSVSFNDTAEKVFSSGLDNQIRILDLRKKEVDGILYGHTETITGLALSNDGSYLLSNAMDHTVRCWDVRPFVVGNRCVKIFQGAAHNFEKNLLRVAWSKDGMMITAGSADRYVYIWDTTTRKILHKLGGHNGSVNECAFSPKQRLIASASSDKTVILGEIFENTL